MGEKTTRREFLKQAAATGALFAGLPGIAGAAAKMGAPSSGKTRVVIAMDRNSMKGDTDVVQGVLDKMVDKSIAKLMGTSTPTAAWKKLFSPSDVVGIKVNCLFGKGVSTRPEVVQAVIRGLKMAGVKEDKIIIWDRSTGDLIKSGFSPNRDKGVQCYGDDGDWGEMIEQGEFRGRITKFISEKVTAIINMPVLKTHGISGISCCLKNHYGSMKNPSDHHGNHGNPYLADFSSIPMVKNKTRLVVVDALRPQWDGGPGYKGDAQFNHYSLILSKDPVAADYQGLQIIQSARLDAGRKPIRDEITAWLQSAQDRGVGVCDPKKMEVIRV